MRVLMVPFGSEGDVNPLVWLAEGLKSRGHEPVFVVTPHYKSRVSAFEWHPIGTEEDFQRMAADPDLWKPVKGTLRVASAMSESLGEYWRIFRRMRGQFDLVVASSFGFSASCFAEATKTPCLMLHLQPVCVRSVTDFPLMGAGFTMARHFPAWAKHLVFGASDIFLDSTILPELNNFRAALKLPRWRSFYRDALMGGTAIGLLYPDWFASPQSDWPQHAKQFGFPISPVRREPLPVELSDWLKAGEPPVLWTHGSANFHTADFFQSAMRVSSELGMRALLVGRKKPEGSQPSRNVLHWPHVNFESVFPECRAVVHHAGIGTTSKAFAAGLPQLAVPLAHDQFDNAERIARLGAGVASSLSLPRIRRDLKRVTESEQIAEGARKCRALSASGGDLNGLCAFAETLAARSQISAAS